MTPRELRYEKRKLKQRTRELISVTHSPNVAHASLAWHEMWRLAFEHSEVLRIMTRHLQIGSLRINVDLVEMCEIDAMIRALDDEDVRIHSSSDAAALQVISHFQKNIPPPGMLSSTLRRLTEFILRVEGMSVFVKSLVSHVTMTDECIELVVYHLVLGDDLRVATVALQLVQAFTMRVIRDCFVVALCSSSSRMLELEHDAPTPLEHLLRAAMWASGFDMEYCVAILSHTTKMLHLYLELFNVHEVLPTHQFWDEACKLLDESNVAHKYTSQLCALLPRYPVRRMSDPTYKLDQSVIEYTIRTDDPAGYTNIFDTPPSPGETHSKLAEAYKARFIQTCRAISIDSSREDVVAMCNMNVACAVERERALSRWTACCDSTWKYGDDPITLMPIVVPVRDVKGRYFERDAIAAWIFRNQTNPIDRDQLQLTNLNMRPDDVDSTWH